MLNIDLRWFRDINDFAPHSPGLHWFFASYALWGGPVLIVALLVVGWWRGRGRADASRAVATAVLTGIGSIVALVLNQQLISPVIARARPCATLPHVEVLLTCSADYSMPSDHCMIAGALAAGLWCLSRRLGALATVLALLLAFARVYVGVHYPSDVLVGLLLGAVIGATMVLALRAPADKICNRLVETRLRPLVRAASTPVPAEPGASTEPSK